MGHAEPQASAAGPDTSAARQPCWMPFSPNQEFKAEPKQFARAEGMYFYTPEGQHIDEIVGKLRDAISAWPLINTPK